MAIIIDSYIAAYPTIQDTFLGIKMGSQQTSYSIKSAIGYKGENTLMKNMIHMGRLLFLQISYLLGRHGTMEILV